jgi:signal transduction histidine kinase
MPDTRLARWIGLLAAVAAITALHFVTPLASPALHALYQRLYYVPVILAAYWFGVRGGLLVAVLCSLAYAPHIHVAWSQNAPYTMSQYAELAVFLALGVSVGLIASHQRRLVNRYREAAESLARANRDLRESGEKLRRAERLSVLGEIAAGLAHEIRNPLAGMKGALEIVSGRVSAGTPEAEFAEIAAREARRLEGLVQEFLDYARPRPPRLQPGELPRVLHRALSLLGPEAEAARVTLATAVDDAADGPSVDPEQFQQVVVNVLLNAIQASPRGGRVSVRYRRDEDRGVIEVTDQGPGVPPEAAARLFEPFFTTKERGSGLGLAISQRIVSAHGGEIRLEPAPGGGTRVEIGLPIERQKATSST